jgi:hypothetical protein
MTTFNLYVGANNKTGKVEVQRLQAILDKNHAGYTLNFSVKGVWKSKHEASVIVTIADEHQKVLDTVTRLKRELKQEAIGLQVVNEIEFI